MMIIIYLPVLAVNVDKVRKRTLRVLGTLATPATTMRPSARQTIVSNSLLRSGLRWNIVVIPVIDASRHRPGRARLKCLEAT
jgi:hypothetical protein